jgi:hypothetical protein
VPDFDFSLGQDDDGVPWTVPLFDDDGNAIDPAGGSAQLYYRIDDDSAAGVTVDAEVVHLVDGEPDQVRYTWLAADTAVPGVYNVEWLVTLASGARITYPGRRYMKVRIKATP